MKPPSPSADGEISYSVRSAKGEFQNSPVDYFEMRAAVVNDRGKNYFAFNFWGEIILQAFPTGTLRPCKRGRSLSGSNISFAAFHDGTPNIAINPQELNAPHATPLAEYSSAARG